MTLPKNQMDDSSCIIRVLSKVLTLLIDVNQKSNTRQPFVTKFQSSYAPAISIQGYLERINKYAKCSPNCFIVALIYIDRLIEFRNFVLTSLNVHRILITSVLLSTKVFDDEFYKNAYYAKLGGVSTSEMNSLELEFLTLVNFRLYVSTEIFEKYHRELQNFMNVSSPSQIILSTSSSDANNQQSDKGLLGGGRADGTSNSDTIERNADPTVISPLKPADINVKVPRSYLFNSGVHFPSISSPSINNNINSNIPSSSSSSTTASTTNSTTSTSSSILPSFNSSTLFHPEDPIVQYPSCRILPWISSCSSASTSSNTILASVSRDSPRSLISYPSSDPSPTLSSSSSSFFSSQNCQENESHLRNELSQDSYPQFQQQSFASTSSSSHPSTTSQSQLLHLLSTNIGNATNDMECIFDYHQHQYQLNNHNNFNNNNINNNNVNNNNHSHNHIPVINTYCYTEAKHSMPPFQPIPIRVETVGVPCANPVGLISNFNSHTQLPSQQSMVSSHQTAQLSTLSSSLGFQNNNNCNNNNNNKQSQQTQIHHQQHHHHQQQQHSSRQRVPSNPNSNISHFNQQYNMRSFPPYQSRQSQSSSSIESNGANYLQHYDLTGCNYNMSQTQTQQHHQHQHQPIFSHPVNYNPNTPISFCPQPSTQQHPPINCNNNGNNSLNNNNNININNNNNINNNSKYIGGNSINGCGHQVQYTGLQYPQISSAHMQGGYFYQPIPATNIVTSSRFLPYSSTPNSVTDIFGPANDNTSPHLNQPYPLLHSDEMIIPRSTPQLHQQQHQQALGHSNFLGFGSNNAHPHNMGVQHSYIPWIEQHDSHIYGNNISSSHFQCLPEIHSSNLNTYPASTLFYPVMALQSAS